MACLKKTCERHKLNEINTQNGDKLLVEHTNLVLHLRFLTQTAIGSVFLLLDNTIVCIYI